jgi:hypothetical protein
MSEKPNIAVLTAAYNDWESLKALLPRIDAALVEAGACGQVVVIDDGSPSFVEPGDYADCHFSAISSVDVVTLTRNLGNQRAVAVGVAHVATNIDCDALVIMDCDHEDKPEYIPQLLAALKNGGERIVFAARTERSESRTFRFFYGIYTWLYHQLTGMPISIGNFSAIPRRLIPRVAGISEIWSHFPAGIMRARVPFTTIPSARGKRLFGQSRTNFVSLIIHGLSGFAVHADVVIVRVLIAVLGIALAITVYLGFLIVRKFIIGDLIVGWATQVFSALGGILLQALFSALLVVFLVLAGRNQRSVIPARDFRDYIMETIRIYSSSLIGH